MLFYQIPLKSFLEIESILQYKFFLKLDDILNRDYSELLLLYDKLIEIKEQENEKKADK